MPKSCLVLVGLLAFSGTGGGLAQSVEESSIERQPPVDESPSVSPPQESSSAAGETHASDELISLEKGEAHRIHPLDEFQGYRYSTNSLEWIPGGGGQFGMFSIVFEQYIKPGIDHGIAIGMDFNFLAGPKQTDMPPRVYDFSIGYQVRQRVGPLAFDLAAVAMASSDFEGSARKGIRFPGHGVGYLSVAPNVDLVFGVDYLDRGDIKLLPVGGLVWTPKPEMRFEAIFPRPRAVFQLCKDYRFYLAGELGGGSWAVERMPVGNDLATYRDLRVCIGVESVDDKDGHRQALEIGYLFDRRLIFSSGVGDMHLDDSVVLRLVTTY